MREPDLPIWQVASIGFPHLSATDPPTPLRQDCSSVESGLARLDGSGGHRIVGHQRFATIFRSLGKHAAPGSFPRCLRVPWSLPSRDGGSDPEIGVGGTGVGPAPTQWPRSPARWKGGVEWHALPEPNRKSKLVGRGSIRC